jgi:hypothetical protein
MTSRSNPDWLAELLANEGDAQPIDADSRDSLVAAIASAAEPASLDMRRHEQLLARALGGTEPEAEDPFAPPSDHELAGIAGRNLVADDPLAASLLAAYAPQALPPEIERSIRVSVLNQTLAPIPRRRPSTAATLWGALAVAAVAVLWIASATQTWTDGVVGRARPQANLTPSRSTRSMFAEPFANSTASQRIDRIAQARQKDLRENRYLMWGLP